MRTLSFGISLVGSLCLLAVACTQETADPIENEAGGAGGTAGTAGAGGTAGTGSGGSLAGGTGGTAGAGTGGTFTGGTGGGGASGGLGGGGTGGLGAGGGGAGGGGGSGGAAGGAGGAGGGGGSGGGSTVPFSEVSSLINTTCGKSGCHSTGAGTHMPNLTSTMTATQFQNLKNTMVQECGNKPLVTPGDPANSAILSLVQKDCGQFVMPADCGTKDPCIPQADIDKLTDWIEGGAPGPT